MRIAGKLSALWVVAKITRIHGDSNFAILVNNLVHDIDFKPCKYSGVVNIKEKATAYDLILMSKRLEITSVDPMKRVIRLALFEQTERPDKPAALRADRQDVFRVCHRVCHGALCQSVQVCLRLYESFLYARLVQATQW